ncbi:MEKHLA domain-containing protein [Crocosphaera sp. UHCC 0190]|uniref:MEKHLA domain-containing protein n=1 Tax=Crocosphaera sp. UHCC 0190 TaxID=3110246 RepID=UPI002B1FF739|nr:MEKHLA domain-containing protein [Crocosphaera sp. UHCC 0190]MEA5508255.1 MEKHLA domain-containing protein [Crocosphaera sp. UHCC 0190]
MNSLPWQQEKVIQRTQLILSSFQHWLGHSLWKEKGLPEIQTSPQDIAQQLFEVPFAVASHGTEIDPIFNYGNQKALEIWELTWEEFTQIPSRKTAELVEQAERDHLLAETTKKGFCYFSGIRITSTGKRFKINNGIVWNVINEQQNYQGQAAVYSDFYFL